MTPIRSISSTTTDSIRKRGHCCAGISLSGYLKYFPFIAESIAIACCSIVVTAMSFGAVEGLFSTSSTSPGRSATSSRDMFVAVRDSSTDVYCKQMLILRSWTFRRCVERYKGGCGGQGCLPSHTLKEGRKVPSSSLLLE